MVNTFGFRSLLLFQILFDISVLAPAIPLTRRIDLFVSRILGVADERKPLLEVGETSSSAWEETRPYTGSAVEETRSYTGLDSDAQQNSQNIHIFDGEGLKIKATKILEGKLSNGISKANVLGGTVLLPDTHKIAGAYIIPKEMKVGASTGIPILKGFQETKMGDIIPNGYRLEGNSVIPDSYSITEKGTILPPSWKDGGENAFAVPSFWVQETKNGIMKSVPYPKRIFIKYRFPDTWTESRSSKKYLPPKWTEFQGMAFPSDFTSSIVDSRQVHYQPNIFSRYTSDKNIHILVPKIWRYFNSRIVPSGMKSLQTTAVIPEDWLYYSATNTIMPNKVPVKFLFESKESMSDQLLTVYLSQLRDATDEEIKFLEEKSKEKDDLANIILGYLHLNGYGSHPPNPELSLSFFQKASEQGNPIGSMNMGRHHYSKEHPDHDHKALEYFQDAADKGLAEAKYWLGAVLMTGKDAANNEVRAFQMFKEAADGGSSLGLLRMGYAYHTGPIVERNFDTSLMFFQLAADQGNAEALTNVGYIFEKGYGVQSSLSKAKYFYQKALERDPSNTIFSENLARVSKRLR